MNGIVGRVFTVIIASVATAVLVLDAWQQVSESIQLRTLLLLAGVLAVAGVVLLHRLRPAYEGLWPAFGLAIVIVLGVLGLPLLLEGPNSAGLVMIAHAMIGMTAGVALVAAVVPPSASATPSSNGGSPIVLGLIAAAVVVVLGASFVYMGGGRPIIIDEVLYAMESRSPLVFPRAEMPFFALRQTFLSSVGLMPQYPPGWPWVLKAFRAIGLETWSPAICSGLIVFATAVLARRVNGPATATTAAALVAAAPVFLFDGSFHSAHTASSLALLLAALAVVPGPQESIRSSWRWLVFGAFVGFALITRPLTGATVGLSIAAWSALGRGGDVATLTPRAFAAAAGALPLIAALLWFQAHTTGHALESGYAATNGALHKLGFGLRGFVSFQGGQAHDVAQYFGPREALAAFFHRVWDAGLAAETGAIAIPLIVLAAAARLPNLRWNRVALFLPLPAAHAFYFYSEPRFYNDLLPFMAIGLGLIVDRLGLRSWRQLTLLAAVLAAALGIHTSRMWAIERSHRGDVQLYGEVADLSRRCGPLLVFASDTVSASASRAEPHLESLYWFNVEHFGGSVLVARDLGATDSLLTARQPDRLALVAGAHAGMLTPIRWPATRAPADSSCRNTLSTHLP